MRNHGVKYVKEVCLKFQKLNRTRLTNPSKSNTAKEINDIFNGHIPGCICAKITDPQVKKQRAIELEILMLVDSHVLCAKKIGIDDERIRHVLLQQLETNHLKFTNRRDLLNAILDQPKELTEESGKCVKCKREQRNALCMPCGHLLLCWT